MKEVSYGEDERGGGVDGQIETACDNFNEKIMKEACPIGMKHAKFETFHYRFAATPP